MIQRKGKTEKSRNLLGAIILYFLLIVFFGIVAVFTWLSYFNQYEIAAIIDKDTKAMATLTEVRHIGSSPYSLRGGYYVWYEYTDEDDTHYQGEYSRHSTTDKGEAEAYVLLGKKVEIFIDGQGGSVLASEKPKFTYFLVLAIIFTISAGGVVAFIIAREILLVKDRKLINKTRGN